MKIFIFFHFFFLVNSSSADQFSVTILNDSKLADGIGFIHTWLKIEGSNKYTKYFSFENIAGKHKMHAKCGNNFLSLSINSNK